jgi:hypothetical protein
MSTRMMFFLDLGVMSQLLFAIRLNDITDYRRNGYDNCVILYVTTYAYCCCLGQLWTTKAWNSLRARIFLAEHDY